MFNERLMAGEKNEDYELRMKKLNVYINDAIYNINRRAPPLVPGPPPLVKFNSLP